ncbi:hypothetical protein [Citreimonas salinaria]|uniref:Recombinase zinc beta ribbon domain-containing protein n=1 Tax=Citreimonas salinaria TaxID=321339 RepID=A0A1H3P2I6_9RHOB|nr:hypothetical protein [Citreimonas salinaria]SDY95230.1 hypothetical protein SAMN05444340_1441 [Citreimonas salinaria]
MTVAGAGKYKTYYCANAKEKGPSVCSGFRGLRDSIALPLVLSGLRNDLMKPDAYVAFRKSVQQRLKATRGAAKDALDLHDNRVRGLETARRNPILPARQGLGSQSLVEELNQIDADLVRLTAMREEIIPPEIKLPDGLPDLYREMIRDIAATLSEESVASRAADALHELVDRIVVD